MNILMPGCAPTTRSVTRYAGNCLLTAKGGDVVIVSVAERLIEHRAAGGMDLIGKVDPPDRARFLDRHPDGVILGGVACRAMPYDLLEEP